MRNLLLIPLFCFLVTGCGKNDAKTNNPPEYDNQISTKVEKVITTLQEHKDAVNQAAAFAVEGGLKLLAKKKPDEAKQTAQILGANAKMASKYFSGEKPPLAKDAKATLDALGSKVPTIANSIIPPVIAIIQAAVKIPDATTVINPDEAALIVAFLDGIVTGCDAFLK